jgi:hypothetical protein
MKFGRLTVVPGDNQTVIDTFVSAGAALAVSYKITTQSTTQMVWTFGTDVFSHCGIVLQ